MKNNSKLAKRIVAVLVAIVMVFQYGLGVSDVSAAETYDMEAEKFVTSVEVKAEVGGVFYDVTDDDCPPVPKDAKVRIKIAYNPEYDKDKNKIKFNEGDKITYKLPEGISIVQQQTGNVIDGPTAVGNYVIDTNGNISITITNKAYLEATDGNLKNGTISFRGKFNSGAWGEGGDRILSIGGQTIKVPFIKDNTVEKANLTITKTDVGDKIKWDSTEKCYYIEYSIQVKADSGNTKTVKNVVVTDAFTAGESYVDTSAIYGVSVPTGTTFDKADLKWTIGDMVKGQSKTLKFKVKLTDKMTQAGSAANRVVKNTAYLKADNISKSATATTTTSAGVTIKKTNAGYDINNKTVTYTVVVKANDGNKWTLNNVTVEDVFGDNKKYVTNYVSSTPSNGVSMDAATKKVTWNVGSLAPKESKTLKYTVKISDDIFTPKDKEGTVTKVLKNTAKVKVNGTEKGKSNSDVTFKKVWITKSGSDSDNDGVIKFVIKANASTNKMPVLDGPFEFYDALNGSKWEYTGDIEVKWYNQGPTDKGTEVGTKILSINNPIDGLTVNADKTSWKWTSGSGNYYYEIVYYAKLKDENTAIGTPSISNKAGIIVGVNNNDYTHEATWTGYGKTFDALKKKFESINDDNVASWKSSIICSIPKGATYEDYRTAGEGLEWNVTDISKIKITFNGQSINGLTTITKKGSGFIVTFNEAIDASEANPIYIEYDTTLNVDSLKPAEVGDYINKAKLTIGDNTDTAQDECTYLKDHKFDKLAAGSYDPVTKCLTWDMKVNITGSMEGTAYITDNLPGGLEFVKAEITSKGSAASEDTKIKCTPSEDKKSVGIAVENLVKSGKKDAYVIITLTTKVVDTKVLLGIKKDTNDDGVVDEKDADSYTFENDAALFYGGRTYNDSAEHEINNVTLTKHGIYNEDTAPNIVYEIEVNPEGVDMLSGENEQWITVEDTMSDNLIFIQDSLKVEHLTTGEAVAYKNLVVGENKENLPYFTLEVPDNKPLKITYQAYVSGETGKPAEAVNTVKFLGYGSYPGEEASNSIEILESKATIEGETNFFIKKTDGVTFEPLAGAVYELTEYKLNGTTIETERRTVKSDNLGTVIFSNLDEDCVYGFKEVTAPEGYYIDEINAKETFVAIESNELTDGLRNELIAKLEAEGKKINYMKKGASFYRNNYKGEISVDKNFIGEVTDGTYYFGLFNTNGKIVTLNGNTAVVSADVKDGQFVKEAVFRGVPFGKYYVYETDSEGKRLTTDSEGAVTVNGTKYLVSGEGSVEVSYEDPKATIGITNEYNDDTSIKLEAGKILENANYPLGDSQFSFKLTGPKLDNGEVVVTNDAEGKVSFPEIIYKVSDLAGASEKVFNYTISEVIPDEKQGITYSTDIYDVQVKVKKANGELSAEYKVLLNGEEVTLAQFTNTYDAEGKVQFEGTKVLENANYELKDNQFSFELKGPKLDDGVVVTNDADGKIRFPEIEYELADLNGNRSATFEYTVAEVNGGKTIEGVTYSDEVFDIVVTVTDNLDGTLKTEYVAKNSEGEAGEIEFINTYDAEPISTTIEGEKEAIGFTLQEGDFAFVLVETTEGVAEDTLYTAYESNAADGTFKFELPEYDLSDNGKEFTYEVREYVPEDANKKGGVTYDSAVYTVTVRISDNMDGTLKLEKAITKGGEAVSEPVGFTNEFAGSVELTKTNGKTGDDYETLSGAVFELYKVNGGSDELVGTYTTGDGGKIRAEGLVEGEYYFVEETPPAGYSIITDASNNPLKYEFQIGPNGGEAVVNKNIEIANEQKLGELSLIKKDADNNDKVIEGAVFTLYKDGEVYQEGLITNEKGVITVTSLPWGEYYFVETAPAPGYVADTKPTDKVVIDAKYVDASPITVEKTNKQTEFYITKTDINGEKYLTGSTVEIFKVINAGVQPASEDGATSGEEEQIIPITSWTSDGSNHLIKGILEVGETYIIKETAAPTGYGLLESYIEFTVNEDGSITSDANFAIDENGNRVLLVQDDIIDLKVTKTDYVTGKNLEGAVLAVFDKESGEEIVRWTSTKEGHYDFGAHLTANKTYILKELQAPEGYEKIDDVVFKVLNEGQVEVVTESELVKYEKGQLEIGNCPIPAETPDTGDHTPLGMSMILMTLAMIGMVSAAMPRKRRSH